WGLRGSCMALGGVLGPWLRCRFRAALRSYGTGLVAVALCVIGLVVHVAAPLYAGGGEPPVKPKANAPAIPVMDTGLKVIFVGFDGADWRVARPMMAKGELPTFSRIVR